MKILITGAAGNLGSLLTQRLLAGPHELRLMVHRKPVPLDLAGARHARNFRADLADPAELAAACGEMDAVVHFAGVLFAPHPERFLPTTNTAWTRNLVDAALAAGVRKFILVSFPHVEGETTPEHPASGRMDGAPASVHARTRLAAEQYLVAACEGQAMAPVILRPGMIYGRGVLMVDAARWLARRHLLAVWKAPTSVHLLALPDFLSCVQAALESPNARGIYTLGDDAPTTLQAFADAAARQWRAPRPWRLPAWTFRAAAGAVETVAAVFHTRAPLTRDFVRIGMASYAGDTSRMKAELLPRLAYPTLAEGLALLDGR